MTILQVEPSLVAQIAALAPAISALGAVGAGMFGLVTYFSQRREQQKQREMEAKDKAEKRELRALRPFLERRTQLYDETAGVVGKLVTLDPRGAPWQEAEQRFWALYWCELCTVEDTEVEEAMVKVGNAIDAYRADPDSVAAKGALRNVSYALAHEIRNSVRRGWGLKELRSTAAR